MSQIARTVRLLARRRKLFVLVAVMVALIAVTAVVFAIKPAVPDASAAPPPATMVATAPATLSPAVVHPKRESEPVLAPDEPKTANYKTLATAAAEMIYTWDARNSTFSAVYERVR